MAEEVITQEQLSALRRVIEWATECKAKHFPTLYAAAVADLARASDIADALELGRTLSVQAARE